MPATERAARRRPVLFVLAGVNGAGKSSVGGHLLAPSGRLLAMKGVNPVEEIATLPAGWTALGVHRLAVPGLDAERHLVEVGRAA